MSKKKILSTKFQDLVNVITYLNKMMCKNMDWATLRILYKDIHQSNFQNKREAKWVKGVLKKSLVLVNSNYSSKLANYTHNSIDVHEHSLSYQESKVSRMWKLLKKITLLIMIFIFISIFLFYFFFISVYRMLHKVKFQFNLRWRSINSKKVYMKEHSCLFKLFFSRTVWKIKV